MSRCLFAVAALAAVGCSALVDLDGLRAGDAGSTDAAAADARVVHCGSAALACDAPQACCAVCTDDDSGGCSFTFSCGAAATCSGVTIACSSPSSCAVGQVCCGELGSGSSYFEQSICLTRAECDASAPSVLLCDPNAADPCPNGGQCLLSKTADFAQLYECR